MADLPIVYIIENAQQFWSELDDTLYVPKNASLSTLDAILKRFVHLCATYHEQYLQSPLQLDHAVELLLDSELFTFHSERMCEILSDDARTTTDPHRQLITYNILLLYGRRNVAFFRSYKRWQPIFPMLMDHVLVDVDPDLDDGTWHGLAVPIEAKLRALSVLLLYEACRTSKLNLNELRTFDTAFIERLFDLVEQTRAAQDESFNYSVIKLIVALNEQFMVASLKPTTTDQHHPPPPTPPPHPGADAENRVMSVLMRRLTSSPTFGENMIFMLNRASRSPEDLVMQLLVLKLLYLLFTTKGMSEYFYTNDLCVLVDVFLRELSDLDDEAESLRHTYLRVLHPLLTKTQLRSIPYKRPQIVRMLESLIANPHGTREISATTKRLVERCLAGEWRVGVPTRTKSSDSSLLGAPEDVSRTASPGIATPLSPPSAAVRPTMTRQRSLKGSRSVENMRMSTSSTGGGGGGAGSSSSSSVAQSGGGGGGRLDTLRKTHANESATSLPSHVDGHGLGHANGVRETVMRANSVGTVIDDTQYHTRAQQPSPSPATPLPTILVEPLSPLSVSPESSRRSSVSSAGTVNGSKTRRSAPPPPPGRTRRKPPAVPAVSAARGGGGGGVGLMTNGGARIETIRSSNSAPVVGRAA